MGIILSSLRSYIIGPTDTTPFQRVQFYVLVGSEPVRVSVKPDNNLVELFASLREDPIASGLIPVEATPSVCAFYQLKNPVLFSQPKLGEGSVFLSQARQKCEEVGNRSRVEPVTTTVGLLAQLFSREYAYLAIELPDSSMDVTKDLRENHATLFNCLQVIVECLGVWAPTDMENNLAGGTLMEEITALPVAFREIQDALEQPRRYQTSTAENSQDFQVAQRWYKKQFERVFLPAESKSPALVRSREFAAFYNLLRGFDDDVMRIAGHNVSSSLKTSNFAVHFIQPPFFSLLSHNFEYQQDKFWNFPIFVGTTGSRNALRKFTPRSDCMVVASDFDIPFVICEVTSDRWQGDRSRMLTQAAAVARAGQFLLRPASQKKFFVVVICVDTNMVASRYIVMQSEGGNVEGGRIPVSIHRQCFDLREKDEQVDLLREMYNLAVQVAKLSGELDWSKKVDLHAICMAASKVVSLSDTDCAETMDHSTGDSMC